MRQRLIAIAWVTALVFGACGGDDPTVPGSDEVAQDAGDQEASPETPGDRPAGKQGQDQDTRGKKDQEARGSGDGDGAASGDGGEGEGVAEDDGSSRWYPQQGVYTYAQSGSEEFCDASGCQREGLPATQEVRATYESVSDTEAIVVTAAQASDSRFVRTTTRHTREGAFVTHVRLEFNYQGARFNNDYEPDPPVEVARLPLRAGLSWRGQWDARTSGTYAVSVGERAAVNVGGRTVQAWPLRVETRFRGDFDGTSIATVWVDPATAAVVKTSGRIDVSSFFGDYKTRFEATLREGPGYH